MTTRVQAVRDANPALREVQEQMTEQMTEQDQPEEAASGE